MNIDRIDRDTIDFNDIDEVGTPDDLTFIEGTTDTDLETFTAPAIDSLFDTFNVEAVVICSTGLDSGVAPSNIRHHIESNSTTDNGANFSGLTAAFSPGHQTPFAQDPDGPADWDITSVNALEFGVEALT